MTILETNPICICSKCHKYITQNSNHLCWKCNTSLDTLERLQCKHSLIYSVNAGLNTNLTKV